MAADRCGELAGTLRSWMSVSNESASNSSVQRLAWSPPEVAKLIGVSKFTIYLLLQTGQLYGRRWGKRWIIPDEAVRAFINDMPYEPSGDQ